MPIKKSVHLEIYRLLLLNCYTLIDWQYTNLRSSTVVVKFIVVFPGNVPTVFRGNVLC